VFSSTGLCDVCKRHVQCACVEREAPGTFREIHAPFFWMCESCRRERQGEWTYSTFGVPCDGRAGTPDLRKGELP